MSQYQQRAMYENHQQRVPQNEMYQNQQRAPMNNMNQNRQLVPQHGRRDNEAVVSTRFIFLRPLSIFLKHLG